MVCYYLVSRTGYDGVVMDALGIKIGQFVGIMGDEAESEADKMKSQQAASEHMKKIIKAVQAEAESNPIGC